MTAHDPQCIQEATSIVSTAPNTNLTCVVPGLYCLDSHFKVWGCKGSVRMSVIKVGDQIILYSPVRMSAGHADQIAQLGRVGVIIAPNLYHHRFLRDAIAAFPGASVLVPQGLEAKIGPIPGAETMIENGQIGLPEDLDHHVFSGHAIRETCLFHRPSGTLVTADLIYNLQSEQYPAEKAFFKVAGIYGRPAVPFYHRFAIEKKAAVRRLIETVGRWPIKRIVPCHGRIVEAEEAGAIFANAWVRFA